MAKQVKQQEFANLTPDELKEKYSHLSKEDIDFITVKDKLLVNTGGIGIHKYISLKEKQKRFDLHNETNDLRNHLFLTKEEENQITEFEKDKAITDEAAIIRQAEYLKSVRSNEPKVYETTKGVEINKKTLYVAFKQVFFELNGYQYIETPESLKNIEAVVKYFAKDPDFFNCSTLIKNIDGVAVVPSFDKGLLIVGNYGNGKSTTMKCFEIFINHNFKIAIDKKWDNAHEWKRIRFSIANCHNLISEYEGLSNPEAKKLFFEKYSGFRYSFDDLKKEKIASNYGLINIMQAILEKRHDGNKITFATCNYPENHPNDLSKALLEFGEKYGGHIYDRLFKMFNIIEFKGKSFRK